MRKKPLQLFISCEEKLVVIVIILYPSQPTTQPTPAHSQHAKKHISKVRLKKGNGLKVITEAKQAFHFFLEACFSTQTAKNRFCVVALLALFDPKQDSRSLFPSCCLITLKICGFSIDPSWWCCIHIHS